MATYQNIFTQVQLRGHAEMGIPLGRGNDPRAGKPFFSYLMGKIGNAQVGPIYLGTLGVASFVCFMIVFFV